MLAGRQKFAHMLALWRMLPHQPRPESRLSYPQLIGSVFTLLVEEPVLRIRAIIAMLMQCAVHDHDRLIVLFDNLFQFIRREKTRIDNDGIAA